MTISDFIARLKRLQDQIGAVAQIKLGKDLNESTQCFDYFDIEVTNGDVVLVPSDKWENKKTVVALQLNDIYRGDD